MDCRRYRVNARSRALLLGFIREPIERASRPEMTMGGRVLGVHLPRLLQSLSEIARCDRLEDEGGRDLRPGPEGRWSEDPVEARVRALQA